MNSYPPPPPRLSKTAPARTPLHLQLTPDIDYTHWHMAEPTNSNNANPGFFSVPAFLRQYRAQHGTTQEGDMSSEAPMTEATNFGELVVNALKAMTAQDGSINQERLRMYLALAPSYLLLDNSTNTSGGIASWGLGFRRLVAVLIPLHNLGKLELETVNAASKACSESWSIAGSWRNMEDCRTTIREVAAELKNLLDENGRTYQGEQVYAP